MSEMSGNGNTPEVTASYIDTRIYGNPEDIRDGAAEVYKLYEILNDAHIEMTNSLVPQPDYWAGESADAYEEMLVDFRNRAGENAEFAYRAWEAMRAYAQQLDYHYRDMETIRNDATRCGLEIANDYDIIAPTPAGAPPAMPPADAPMRDQDIYRADLYEHQQQVQRAIDFDSLRKRELAVRKDLENWVRRHLLSVQSNPPKSFKEYLIEGPTEYASKPWLIATLTADTVASLRQQKRLAEMTKKEAHFTRVAQDPSLKRVPPLMDKRLSEALDSRKAFRTTRSAVSAVTRTTAVVEAMTLAYDIATQEETSKTALSGLAGIAAGSITGSAVTDVLVATFGVPAIGAIGGAAAGAAAGVAAGAAASVLYDQVPLEYRERIDNTLWHWPYYIGMGW